MRGSLVTDTRGSLRQNLFTNPSAGTDTTGYYGANATGGVSTVMHATDGGYTDSNYIRFTYTTAPSTTGGGIYVGRGPSARVPVTAGVSYTASAFIRTPVSRSFQAKINWYDTISNAGNILSSSSGTSVTISTAGQWAQIQASGIAPAGAVGCHVTFYAGTPAFLVNEHYDIDGVIVEARNALGPYHSYFDGSSPNARWEGTAHASTSLELADTRSRNLIADSSFSYTYKPTASTAIVGNIDSYFSCPWSTVIDGTMGNCLEYVTNNAVNGQGAVIFPQIANSPGYTRRPLTQVGDVYTVSVYALVPAGMAFSLGFRCVPATVSSHIDGPNNAKVGTGSWQRYTFTTTITAPHANYYLGLQARITPTPAVGTVMRIAKVQVEKASSASIFEATRPDW